MENLIACSLVENGLNCGEASFIPFMQYQSGIMLGIFLGGAVGIALMLFAWAYEEKEFKKKMRDLGYGHILGELSGASEKWIPKKDLGTDLTTLRNLTGTSEKWIPLSKSNKNKKVP